MTHIARESAFVTVLDGVQIYAEATLTSDETGADYSEIDVMGLNFKPMGKAFTDSLTAADWDHITDKLS